jgi:hypothetical protein
MFTEQGKTICILAIPAVCFIGFLTAVYNAFLISKVTLLNILIHNRLKLFRLKKKTPKQKVKKLEG